MKHYNRFVPKNDFKWAFERECDRLKPRKDANERKKLREKEIPKYISIDFWKERSAFNKWGRGLYKIYRVIFVALWFYFLPLIASFFLFLVQFKKFNDSVDTTGDDATTIDLS